MPPLPHPSARAVRFDDAVALDCSHRFDTLADQLDVLARTDRDRTGPCSAEWRGPSRTWFDQTNHATLAQIARASAAARGTAESLRRAIATAAARQLDLNDQARRADEVEVARLALLAATSGHA
jgi:hypothetical protein